MPIRQIQPNFSQMMQDYFGEGGMFPSLWQGTPSYGIQSEGEYYNPDPVRFLEQWGVSPAEPWEGAYPEGTFTVPPFRQHPTDFASDYPRHKERAEVTDFLFAQEESRASVKSERFKLDDLLADIQVTGPNSLKVGGVSKDLERQRGVINQGLIDLDEKRQLELQMQELTFLQNIFAQRQDYERQVGNDYIEWLSAQPRLEETLHAPTACAESGGTWEPGPYVVYDADGNALADPGSCNYPPSPGSGPQIEIPGELYTPPKGCAEATGGMCIDNPGPEGGCIGADGGTCWYSQEMEDYYEGGG